MWPCSTSSRSAPARAAASAQPARRGRHRRRARRGARTGGHSAAARVEVDGPAGGERGEHALVGRPQQAWLHEGLVVEARGQEAPDQGVGSLDVVPERRPDVLRPHVHPRRGQAMGSAHVRLRPDLDDAVGVPVVGSQDAPGPVVLHRAGEHVVPTGQQGGHHRVTVEGRHAGPVPAERERNVSIQRSTDARGPPTRHSTAPLGSTTGSRNSLVSVCCAPARRAGGRLGNTRSPAAAHVGTQVQVGSPRLGGGARGVGPPVGRAQVVKVLGVPGAATRAGDQQHQCPPPRRPSRRPADPR